MHNTDILYKILFGDQKQGINYQQAFCNKLADFMVDKGYITDTDMEDMVSVTKSLEDLLRNTIAGDKERGLNKTMHTLLAGLDNYLIYEQQGSEGIEPRVSKFIGADPNTVSKCLIRYKPVGTEMYQDVMLYPAMINNMINVWKAGAPEYFVLAVTAAFYQMKMHVYGKVDDYTNIETIEDKLQLELRKEYEFAPEVVKVAYADKLIMGDAEGAMCAIGLYTWAVSHDIDFERTAEYEREISCEAHTDEFLQSIKFPIDSLKTILFGKQKQGSVFMTTLSALTAKWLMACGCTTPTSDIDIVSGICNAIHKEFNVKTQESSALAQIIMGRYYTDMTETKPTRGSIVGINVEAKSIGDNGKYEFIPHYITQYIEE